MLTLPQLKSLIKGNAVLSAAEKAGDIKLVYPKKPTISEDRLYGVYTLEVLLVEKDEVDLVEAALRRGGFEFKRTKTGWLASYSFPLTPKDREKMDKADKAAKDEESAVKLAKKDSEIATAIAELRQDLQEIKEDHELMGLIKPSAGPKGPRGPAGPSGPPGKDATAMGIELGDLSNVESEEPREGFVLTYRQGQWVGRAVASGGGGGGGGGIPDAPRDGKQYIRLDGQWVELDPHDDDHGECVTDGGDACDHNPQTHTIQGGDACLAESQTRELDGGYGCNECLEEIPEDNSAELEALELRVDALEAAPDLGPELDALELRVDALEAAPDEYLGEAPQDGQEYTRKDGQWVVATATTGGIEEAPQDGGQYVRENGAWVAAAPDLSAEVAALLAQNASQQTQIDNLINAVVALQDQVDNLDGDTNTGGIECGILLEESASDGGEGVVCGLLYEESSTACGGIEQHARLEECSDALTLLTFEDGVSILEEDGATRIATENLLN